MPRNLSGTYVLPPSNPVVGGTPISTTWAVSTFEDIARSLTASLSGDFSISPAKLSSDNAGFLTKIGIDAAIATLEPRVAALEAMNDARIGAIRGFGRSTAPAHWLICNGAAVSRTQYAKLFAKIGTTYGAGNGTTTFNLPELRAESPRGWDHGRGVDPGRALGSAQSAQLPAHSHTASSAAGGAHTHTGTASDSGVHSHTADDSAAANHTHTFSANTTANDGHTHTYSDTSSSAGSHTHTFNLGRGGSARFDPGPSGNIVATWTPSGGKTTSASGGHSHSFSGSTGGQSANHFHNFSGTFASNGAHTHTITVANSASHTHTLTTTSNGAHTHTVDVANSGVAEARVDNVALLMCIKAE